MFPHILFSCIQASLMPKYVINLSVHERTVCECDDLPRRHKYTVYEGAVPAGGINDGSKEWMWCKKPENLHREEV